MKTKPKQPTGQVRLQKFLAHQGIASRRAIEKMISSERIMVNGKLAQCGQMVSGSEQFKLDGVILQLKKLSITTRVLMYNKPLGEVCSHEDEKARKLVFDALPPKVDGRWLSAGRLDLNTSGLLLFSNNGELIYRLTHPKYKLDREYAVRVAGQVTPDNITNLMRGVITEEGFAKFLDIKKAPEQASEEAYNNWYYVVVQQGANRMVRKLWESQGLQVSRLIRVRFGNIVLPSKLRAGNHYELSAQEISSLADQVSLAL